MRFATGLMLLLGLVAGAAASSLRQNARDAYTGRLRTLQVNLCAKGDRR
ncbi:hypothetical protein [Bradyrhizobium sp. SZCCHNR3003]|nr:hypothetical protein [Bradyrhizobium sp. SZCCHNR3003]